MKVSKKRLEALIQAFNTVEGGCNFCPVQEYCRNQGKFSLCETNLINWVKKEDKKGENK